MCHLHVISDDDIDALMAPVRDEKFDVVLVRDGVAEKVSGSGVDIDEAVGWMEGFNSAMRQTGAIMVIAEKGSFIPPNAYLAAGQSPSAL